MIKYILSVVTLSFCFLQLHAADAVSVDANGDATFSQNVTVEKDLTVNGNINVSGAVVVPGVPVKLDSKDISQPVSVLLFNTGLNGNYKKYELRFYNLGVSSDGGMVDMKLSKDGGNTWVTSSNDYRYARKGLDSKGSSFSTGTHTADNFRLVKGNMNDALSGHGVCGTVTLYNVNSASHPFYYNGLMTYKNLDNAAHTEVVGGFLNGSIGYNINALKIESGISYNSGIVELWGIP